MWKVLNELNAQIKLASIIFPRIWAHWHLTVLSKTNGCIVIFKNETSDELLMINGGYVLTTFSTENNSKSSLYLV